MHLMERMRMSLRDVYKDGRSIAKPRRCRANKNKEGARALSRVLPIGFEFWPLLFLTLIDDTQVTTADLWRLRKHFDLTEDLYFATPVQRTPST